MKVKVPFVLDKYTGCVETILDFMGEEVSCEIISIIKESENPIIVYVNEKDAIYRLNKNGVSETTQCKLYALVNVQNFWVNIYMNVNSGEITNGKGRYGTKEEAEVNIDTPFGCRYHSTIYCD